MDSVSEKSKVNGEIGRRFSPRLNKSLDFDNAGDGDSSSGSVKRRFSPRLHKGSQCVEIRSPVKKTSVRKPKLKEPSVRKEEKVVIEIESDVETLESEVVVDGGKMENGLSDGGKMENGLSDGGKPENGLSDGGKPENGLSDGGNMENGLSDGGKPENGLSDGGKLENGLSDGGKLENGLSDGGKREKDLSIERRMSPRINGGKAENDLSGGGKPEKNLSVERRMSPRVNGGKPENDLSVERRMSTGTNMDIDGEVEKEKGSGFSDSLWIGPDVHVISLRQVERRMSPRLNSVANGHVEASNDTSMQRKRNHNIQGERESEKEGALFETPLQRRASPRLHGDLENGKKKSVEETPLQRRLSPRLHGEQMIENQNGFQETPGDCKRPLDDSDADNGLSDKRSKHEHIKEDNRKEDFECSYVNEITCGSNGEAAHNLALALKMCANKAKKQDEAVDLAGKSDHARVKETLRIFNTYYLQFVQEEEERRKQNEIDRAKQDKGSKSKEDVKRTSCRPDLKAITKMREKKEILYPTKTIGHLPGIDVGYQFYSRAEMVVIGFHSHWLNGIDYIGKSKGKGGEHRNYTLPIAVAVVLSGQYEDNLDNADNIIYTGEGGNDLLGNKLQQQDQVMVRGNLALKNSMEQSVPIRVVRGHKNTDSYSGKIYSFDGLYKVVESWADKGCRGHLVYKYRLERLGGQPKLTSDQVQFVRGRPLKVVSELPGLVCRDLSNGLEDICIPVTNIVDDPPLGPQGFTYMTSTEVAASVKLPPNATGCSCKGSCTNPDTCACAKLNGSDFPYVRRDGGRLVEAKDIVFECGPNCGCKPGCLNRISQRRIKYRLEVYRTPDKGWAVRSWDFIPSGAPVCEYIGVLRRSDELDHIAGNEFIFEIDCLHTINEIEGRERRFGNVSMSSANGLPKIDKKTLDGTPEFCIDAGSRGNVARFINHSCEPNLFVQCILSAHHDLRLARIVLFAADNISPMEELTYDYGYALDSVIGADGKIKILPCVCGTADCRKRLY